jgi:hypothetical protein
MYFGGVNPFKGPKIMSSSILGDGHGGMMTFPAWAFIRDLISSPRLK